MGDVRRFEDIMIDIESLGTVPGCAILSIGAVAFDLRDCTIGPEFSETIHLATSVRAGLTIDPATVLWWFNQSGEAQTAAIKMAQPLDEVLERFTEFCRNCAGFPEKLRPWGNGASFDAPLVEAAYRAVGKSAPWKFWNQRCYRTVKAMYPQVPEAERIGTHHEAHADALHQVKHLFAIRQWVKSRDARKAG